MAAETGVDKYLVLGISLGVRLQGAPVLLAVEGGGLGLAVAWRHFEIACTYSVPYRAYFTVILSPPSKQAAAGEGRAFDLAIIGRRFGLCTIWRVSAWWQVGQRVAALSTEEMVIDRAPRGTPAWYLNSLVIAGQSNTRPSLTELHVIYRPPC